MALLGLMVVLLAVYPSTFAVDPTTLAVDPTELAKLVNELLNKYTPVKFINQKPPMFSLAVSIPLKKNTEKQLYDIAEVIKDDPPDRVTTDMLDCKVYTGQRMIAATVLKNPNKEKLSENTHAEKRVLNKFSDLVNKELVKRNTDLMLFYVRANPCDENCLKPNGRFTILDQITSITKWDKFAFVFSDLFVPIGYDVDKIKVLKDNTIKALEELGKKIGLENIYRCPKGSTGVQNCVNCSPDISKCVPQKGWI